MHTDGHTMVPCLGWQAKLSRGISNLGRVVVQGTSPLKCMKTRVAEEAEESTTMINGSEGIIARCVAHLGHSLDGKQSCGQPSWKG